MKIKRFINSVLACAMVCTAVPYVSYSVSENISITANAVDEYTEGTYQNLTYKAYEDHIEISKCDTTAVSVIVPSEIDDLPVTSIGNSAFSGCSKLKSVTINDGITSIGEKAFYDCSYLQSITLPESLTNIGKYTFSGCSKLPKITIPESVTSIEEGAFSYCSSLTSITLPESISAISYNEFGGCSSLESVSIPESVTTIGDSAFRDCKNLEEITIPKNVSKLGEYVFKDSGLTKITILGLDCDMRYGSLSGDSIPRSAVVYCYKNSLTEEILTENNATFESLGFAPLKGDTTGDTLIDIADIVAISAYVGDSKINLLDEQLIKNGDVQNTGDGLTANDALMIQQYLSGNITTLE